MADFSSVTPDSPGVQNSPVLKPSTGRLPVAFGQHIKSAMATRDGNDNDLDSVVADLYDAAQTRDAAIPALQAAVQDIIVGDIVDHNWQDVNGDGSEGGVGENHDTTNAAARGATYTAPSFTDGNTDNFILIRIPRDSDVRHYRVVISGVEGAIGANLLLALGHSADNSWSYYGYGYAEINAFAGASHTVTLQISDRVLAHTTFDGRLGASALAEARSYIGVWGDIPANTNIPVGAVTEHPLAGGSAISVFYRSRTAHTKAANAPDLDTTNWVLIGPLYQGDWLDTWYHATAMVADDGKLWLALEHVVRGDQRPSAQSDDQNTSAKWKSFGSSDDVDIDALRTEIEGMIAAFASHQEQVVSELPDPTHPEAPGFAYLDRLWQPNQGATGKQGRVSYSIGEYEKTTGTVNRASFQFDSQSFVGQTMYGFVQRGARLDEGSRPIPDLGVCLHNPLGGAVAALYYVPYHLDRGSGEYWAAWVKGDLVNGENPWDIPAPSPQRNTYRFTCRVYYPDGNQTRHFDIPMSVGDVAGIRRKIDGVTYIKMWSSDLVNNQPGAAWVKALDTDDADASTVEVEFGHTVSGSLTIPLWLGGAAEAWTWRDPDDIPNTLSRLSRVERASMVPGEHIATMTGTSGGVNLDERPWTVVGGATGVTHGNTQGNTSDSWSKYLYLDCDVFSQSVADGSNGIIVEAVRSGTVLSTVFIPWTLFSPNWQSDHQFFAGKTQAGNNNANVLYASCGVNNAVFHLRLAGGQGNAALTINIYRNN